ncbi:MAG: ATP-binding protein, partial [Actinomycetota bacterium]
LELRVRVAPLGTGVLLILVDDLAEERRVDAVRRDFVANVSHELKTPVGALSLLAETVLSAADDPEQVRHFAERMQTEASRLASLIQDVIDLSRLQGDDPMIRAAAVDLDELITSAFDEVRTLATSRNIELVRSGEADSELYGDRGQLLTAVRNLLSNAVVYSPPGTRVAVSCASRQGVAEIAVKDQGIGIPGHDLDRIFERFYRVDQARSRSTGGTGLGLSIVKHVCQNHGGECTVWSEVGTGSTFTLRLPVYDPQTDMQRQAQELDIDVVTTPEQGGSL